MKSRLQAIIDTVPDVVCMLDEDGRYVEILTSQPDLLYTDPEALRGRLLSEVLPAAVAAQAQAVIETTLATRQVQVFEYELYISKVGKRYFEGRAAPVATPPGDKPMVVILARDISERRAAEEQLRQVHKMQAVGRLTGGVAHDFNNLLAIAQGNLELLQEALTAQPELLDLAARALEAIERGATLTQRLLAFAGRQPLQPQPTDLNTVVAGMVERLRRALGPTIRLEVRLADALESTMIDAEQFENALFNLAMNARDAMPRGGQLIIETGVARLDQAYADARPYQVRLGDYVMLRVRDTGAGMPPPVRERAFEPFFTTKPVGQGSGLGLSMVYGLVKQSRGYIDIDSIPGRGTQVTLYLPRRQTETARVEEPPPGPVERTAAAETILVVDDNAEVRRLTVTMLRALGYTALEAGDGAVALRLLRETPQVGLLFTDVILAGGMDGMELARQARRRRPDLKLLFASGYPESAPLHEDSLRDAGVLLKPYRKASLGAKLQALLNSG